MVSFMNVFDGEMEEEECCCPQTRKAEMDAPLGKKGDGHVRIRSMTMALSLLLLLQCLLSVVYLIAL